MEEKKSKEKFKQNKRIRSVPFLSAEDFPEWIGAFIWALTEANDVTSVGFREVISQSIRKN